VLQAAPGHLVLVNTLDRTAGGEARPIASHVPTMSDSGSSWALDIRRNAERSDPLVIRHYGAGAMREKCRSRAGDWAVRCRRYGCRDRHLGARLGAGL
jgi:hypothetical protein